MFHAKCDKLHFYKANPVPSMLEYNLQPVVTSFITYYDDYNNDDNRHE